MKNITLKELANQLDLSVSTVSRALTDSYEINIKTKKRVKDLAKKLNYQPNPFASFLRKHKSKTIALIIPEISNNFFSLIIKGVETICQERDYYVLIYESHESFIKEKRILNHLIGGRVDGVLISVSSDSRSSNHLQELLDRKINLVMFDRVMDDLDVVKVSSNDYISSFEATKHLIYRGCKRILFLKAGEHLSTMQKRLNGYKDALVKHNIIVDEALIKTFHPYQELELAELTKLIVEIKPDAIFCSVENLAIACYDVCQKLNINIPNDIKLITFSNLKVARHLNPSLSTISQPAFEMGKLIAEILINEIEEKDTDVAKEIELDCTLIKRDSTK
jgi:LacI family transcriptional regulator